MSKEVVTYMKLACSDQDGSLLDAPSLVRVRLDAQTVELVQDVIRTYQRSKKDAYTEYDFPKEALEYLRGSGRRWEREFENATVSAEDDELAIRSEILNRWGDRAEHVLCATVEYDQLEQEIRRWRALSMGQSLEDAMPGEEAPAPRASGGMTL